MTTVILVIHLLLAIALIGVILLQRSEGGGLGIGGGGGGMGGFMTGRATANLLSRTTAILAVAFMVTSMALALFANKSRAPASILDQGKPAAPATAPAPAQPATPAKPATPEVPIAK